VIKHKILYIDEISRIAGGETWFLNYVDGLNDSDIEPFLLCPEGPFADAARAKGVEVIPYTFHYSDISTHRIWIVILFGFFRIWDSFKIRRIIKRKKIDLVHSINSVGHVISSLLRIQSSVKVLWHIHHDHPKLLYRFFKPDYMVFVAKSRQNILKSVSLERKREYSVMYNGIDTSLYESTNPDIRTPLRIGYVGRLLPEKGIETFLDAAVLVLDKYKNVKFYIYGEEIYDDALKGNYTDALGKKIDHLVLGNAVTIKGFVFPQNTIYESIDMFVMPSHRIGESCPMVILESWSSGVPVIATNVGGIPELVVDGETGYLIPPKDPQAIADAVQYVIEHPDEVKSVVDNAKKLVRERFDYRENARQFVQFYREMLHEQG
jgi:glycosyltransferase involved in cell wall biosynthesis